MDFRPRNLAYVQDARIPVAKKEASFMVYFKVDGKMAAIKVGAGSVPDFDHQDAILSVQDVLMAGGTGWQGAVLAVIDGGKNGN
jgi:hypothetical protein